MSVLLVQLIGLLIMAAAMMHNSIWLMYHIYRILNFHKKNQKISSIEKLSLFAIIAAILLNFVSIIIPLASLSYASSILFIQYLTFKFFLYFLFLERLFRVFNGTPFSFEQHHISLSRILLIILFILMCCCSLFILNNVSIVYIVLIAMDILIGTSISIKLNRNLIIMVLTGSNALDCGIEDNSNELTLAVMFKNDPTASNAIYKFTLLTFIYIASTFCTLTFCVIFGNYSILWMSVDTIIGTIATALMFSVHSHSSRKK